VEEGTHNYVIRKEPVKDGYTQSQGVFEEGSAIRPREKKSVEVGLLGKEKRDGGTFEKSGMCGQ